MKRFGVVLLTSIGAVLALPVSAYAIDHVVLSVTPAKLAKSGTLGAWSLDGRIVDASFSSDREIFGVSLRRSFLQGRAQELHAFRAGPARALTFDRQTGHWGAHFGAALA